jgi:hypothetical protein
MRTRIHAFLPLILLAGLASGQDVDVRSGGEPIDIYVQKEVAIEYHLVTSQEPLVFEVEGPAYLRIYTRYLSKDNIPDDQVYKYILQEDETRERIVSHTTGPSSKSRTEGRNVSKWRSSLLEVPPGLHVYRIILWDVPSDELAFRIRPSTPTEWADVAPLGTPAEAVIPEDEKLVTYYVLDAEGSMKVRVLGEGRLKYAARLNFDATLTGAEANFTLGILEDGEPLERRSYATYRSETAQYRNMGDLIPARVETDYLDVPDGEHVYEFKLEGTLARSVSLRFLMPEK